VADTEVLRPNRDKPESKATRAAVILLLVASGVVTAIVIAGGWSELQGAHIVAVGYVVVQGVMAYFVAKWNRGVLPVAAGLAVLFGVVAAVAAPAWFERDKEGFANPALEPSILGLLTIIIVAVQLLLVAFSMRAFQQQWNIEIEVPSEDAERYRRGDMSDEDLHATAS
jgi:hypothetical protein